LFFQLGVVVFRADDALAQHVLLEDLLAQLEVLLLQVCDRHPLGQRGGDDGAGRGAGNEVEVVAQQQLVVVVLLAKIRFDLLENPERQDAPQAATIERQDALRTAVVGQVLRERASFGGHGSLLVCSCGACAEYSRSRRKATTSGR
jgi:hypothetical protein